VLTLSPVIGYNRALAIAQLAQDAGTSLRDAAIMSGDIRPEEFDKLVAAKQMVGALSIMVQFMKELAARAPRSAADLPYRGPMKAKQFGNEHVLVFAVGEQVLETLNTYLLQHTITAAQFMAIGGFSQVQLACFNVQTKQYERRDVNEQVEVISLIGNVALMDGKPFVHAHVCVGTREHQAHAGHLRAATVRPTLELFLTELIREQDLSTGLEGLQP
jgi:predicted DNA-binding protein with PD1-like motif